MNINDVMKLVENEREAVEKNLIDNLDSDVEMVNKVAEYIFESGGKRLRPVFMILSALMCGYDGERTINLAGVVEYIHTATLLHDDVIDGAKYRRGKESANNVFGNDITVLCGDFLYSRAFMNLVKDGDSRAQMLLAVAARTMSEGEVFQLIKTADVKITMDDYLRIINSKTAVMFATCCEIGAILGEMPVEKQKALADFGKTLGIAFQMADDILDYLGDPEKTGKKPGTDLKEGKITLPIITLLANAAEEEKKRVRNIIVDERSSEENLNYILDLMNTYDVKAKSELVVDKYIQEAKANLNLFEKSKYRDALDFLADYMVARDR
ncbi:Trans-hexaprenyltranstransferase [Denitrovibrio acetiphilus DSM 12809]|uniref:Trans-hexaprenyltranstransferase n=1 Tax=Denitrovibrio acetiphilus (strain DSM 12809 / NBRC 114555 / N2460) TaxID=522772 RepID=D4H7H0_DENA2|nr:polyprenyl synthetase family protein [Denitrovibrio acetiphilus]ADD67969.1 Trans-hexaprenyltranstransferase [Denitrovibrio acetiphilus DSM 12809]